ncbi:MAG: hypothetical protein IKE60_01885 [Reyranella sp.]|jgi:hypothetical protein|uniref:hypothetical protein n=1 Tax=Reyranella sp. TaxID=1929291 RepID=UPI0025F7F114|nr:hypothetical protein [Reyranella sp.]MBR2813373.1 hypothetical protein [Reyranella sp.]
MTLLYIDHSIVSREQHWPDLKAVMETGQVQLGLSLWNFFEIAGASDAAQKERRVAFLLQFNPQWIRERRDIQRDEVFVFLTRHYYRQDAPEVDAIARTFSTLVSTRTRQYTPLGLTPRQWMATLDPTAFGDLKKRTVDALVDLQRHGHTAMSAHEPQIFEQWIEKSLPLRAPDGRCLLDQERRQLLAYCADHRGEVLDQCPALGVEHALSLARTDDPNRRPSLSDAPDLMHSVVALAYADYYLVNDAYARRCAAAIPRFMPSLRLAEVYKDSASLLAAVLA